MTIANTPDGASEELANVGEGKGQDVAWLDGILLDQSDEAEHNSAWADPLAVEEVGDRSSKAKSTWLQKTFGMTGKADHEVSALEKRIQQLQAQLQLLAARPSVYEMDESELLAVAGEDAAVLVRAAKAKSQSMLRDAEDRVNKLRDEALARLTSANAQGANLIKEAETQAAEILAAAQEKAAKIIEMADEDATMTQTHAEREKVRVINEAELRLSEARTEVDRMKNEAQERNADWLSRTRAEAQAEAKALLDDAYFEKAQVLERLKDMQERARRVADESTKVRRNLIDLYKDTQIKLSEAITEIQEIDERSKALAEQAQSAVQNT